MEIDWSCTFEKMGLTEDDYDYFGGDIEFPYEPTTNYLFFCFKNMNDSSILKVRSDEVIKKIVIVDSIIVEEIAYQRKGCNREFYIDAIWDEHPTVAELNRLLNHWLLYFSDTDEYKQQFLTNFFQQFIEGETFVYYDA